MKPLTRPGGEITRVGLSRSCPGDGVGREGQARAFWKDQVLSSINGLCKPKLKELKDHCEKNGKEKAVGKPRQ